MAWPTLTTDRLLLRPLTIDDLDDLAALHAEESFWHFPFGRGWSTGETESFLTRTVERSRARGFATEAGAAWLRFGFEELDLGSIVSIYEPQNTASGNVMRRLGFTLARQTMHPTYRVPLHVMSLTDDAWRSTS